MGFSLRLPGSEKKKEDVSYTAVEVDPNSSNTDISTQHAAVSGWPGSPERISSAPIWIVGDFILLLMPIAFIALAGLAYNLDGKPLSPYGERVQEVILLGPTLFPLAFAALGGRSLKKIALWKAERGTTLGFLEHVIGSQSLVAAVGHAITLHSLNFLTLGLLLLWALSPLGGQSALRLIHHTNATVSEIAPIFYSNVNAYSDMPKESYNEDAVKIAEAVLMTSLMTADTNEFAPLDTWNHPKIPRIDALEQDAAKNSTDRPWYTVEKKVNQTYAALTGVDVMGLRDGTDANFTVPYEYMFFECGMHPSTNATNNLKAMAYLNDLQKANRLQSGSQYSLNMTLLQFMGRGFFIWGESNSITVNKLLYGTEFFSNTFFLFECSVNSVLLEANVECQSDICEAKRLRRLLTTRSERNTSAGLPYDVVRDGYIFKYFVTGLNPLGGNASINSPNPINSYLYGNAPWGKDPLTDLPPWNNWTTYIPDPKKSVEMSHRLTRFLNTYWDATRWPMAITRNDPYAKSSLNVTSGEPPSTLRMNKTDAVVSHQVLIYKADIAWVATLITCSCVLLLLGVASFLLSLKLRAPDIFDYVSSFTRDNPYILAPSGGSGMDGATRARLLRKLPVQLGDVEPTADTGYIAMRSVEGEKDGQQARIRRDRRYR